MAIDPHTFFDFLQRTTRFFRYVELDKEVHEAADLAEDGEFETRQFGRMFNSLSFRVDEGQIRSVFQLGAKEARLAIELSYMLAYHYKTALGFNAIRLPADPAGRYGALSMEDYFITPSYVPEADLQKRESLLRAEKESSSNKLERMKAKYFQNFLPHDYISGSLFEGVERVVVTGNPGVGKSTYARWLCYTWAKQAMNIKGLLVHIDLRYLRFGNGNSLVAYVATHYMKTATVEQLQRVLAGLMPDCFFVLDGFDELGDQQQKALVSDLHQLSPQAKFILLSRPYGLLNPQGLSWDFSMQIDGFNNSNIYNYIDTFLALNNRQHLRERLLQIITQNRVLEDYAHNPLMLSYITYAFLEDADPEQRLSNVYSQYDLQDLVFGWMQRYEQAKKSEESLRRDMKPAQCLACNMELDMRFVLYGRGPLDDEVETAKYLSYIGLGNLQWQAGKYQWQFSFNTLTFQEFLAARQLADVVSTDGFLYLCREKYFWNFTRMLIGCLSHRRQKAKIEEILDAHLAKFEQSKKAIHWYFYIVHLSETSPAYLERKVSEEQLANMYIIYQMAFWDNKNWRPLLLDALARMYSKLPFAIKQELQRLLVEEMEGMLEPSKTPNIEHVKALALKLRLERDRTFLQQAIRLLERIMTIVRATEYSSTWDAAYELAVFLFEEVLCKADRETLVSLAEQLKSLIRDTHGVFMLYRAKLELHFLNKASLPRQLEERCDDFEQFLHKHKGETERLELGVLPRIQSVAAGVYQIGTLYGNERAEEKARLQPLLVRGVHVVLKGMGEAGLDDYDQDEAGELLIKGLVGFDDPSLYDWILEAALVIQPSYLHVRIPDNESFFAYLETLLQPQGGQLDEQAMDKLIISLNIIENARNQFARIREAFAGILRQYVLAHQEAFANSAGGYVQAKPDDQAVEYYDITSKFNQIIDSALTDSEVFAYDKKYLIDQFTDFHHYRYFRNFFHPAAWGRDFNLYQQDYWALVLTYTNDVADLPALMSILRNPSIYRYASNLEPLGRVMAYFLLLPTAGLPDNFPSRLVELLSRCLSLVKEAEKGQNIAQKEHLLSLTINLVHQYQLKTVFQSLSIDQMEGKDLVLFILLYHFTKDKAYDLQLNYDEWLSEYPRERMDLINHLIALFTHNDRLVMEELQQLFEVLVAPLVNRLLEVVNFREYLIAPFERKKFEELCQS